MTSMRQPLDKSKIHPVDPDSMTTTASAAVLLCSLATLTSLSAQTFTNQVLVQGLASPTGITLAPNGRLLYVSNSDERSVLVYDLDRAGPAETRRSEVARATS